MTNGRLDIAALMRLQRARQKGAGWAGAPSGDGRLTPLEGFGGNPGGLRMLAHVPDGLPPGAPLVVALHGCTQTAAGYDRGCGWSAMADRLGFALLLPEQQRANNPNLCFNWFEPGDMARDAGEALSIRQAVARMVQLHGLDPARVFVTGLSAGGAMAGAMLAAYPDVFAAGAIVAGLPYGSARGVPEALRVMARPESLSAASRGGSVRAASPHRGPWPRVAVWHGEADATVHPANAAESVKQWLHLHGLDGAAPVETRRGGHAHRRWAGPDGRAAVECHRIDGMGHGVPLHPGEAEEQCGVAGPWLLDVGVSSTHGILEFWGLADAPARPRATPAPAPIQAQAPIQPHPHPQARFRPAPPRAAPDPMAAGAAPSLSRTDPGAVITQALRAAGLMS